MNLSDLNKKLISEAGVAPVQTAPAVQSNAVQPAATQPATQPQAPVQPAQAQAVQPGTVINTALKSADQVAGQYISNNKQLAAQSPTQLVSGALTYLLTSLKQQLGIK